MPRGDRYILLFGAEDSNVFSNPLPGEIHEELPARGKEMLALRIAPRVNIFTEAARVEGPAATNYREGMALAPCIQMGSFQSRWQDEEEVLAWYSRWRMPASESALTSSTGPGLCNISALPSFLQYSRAMYPDSARRYRNAPPRLSDRVALNVACAMPFLFDKQSRGRHGLQCLRNAAQQRGARGSHC